MTSIICGWVVCRYAGVDLSNTSHVPDPAAAKALDAAGPWMGDDGLAAFLADFAVGKVVSAWSTTRVQHWAVLVAGVPVEDAQKIDLDGETLEQYTSAELDVHLRDLGLSEPGVTAVVEAWTGQRLEGACKWQPWQVRYWASVALELCASDVDRLSGISCEALATADDTLVASWGLSKDGETLVAEIIRKKDWAWNIQDWSS